MKKRVTLKTEIAVIGAVLTLEQANALPINE